ncbi:MAG: winged helix-turn-helix transcriptional regulator [Candidatus Thermoplasmatota archaeon]
MEIEEVLKRSKAIDILNSLIEKPKNVIEVYKTIPGGSLSTLELRLKELINAGLIKEDILQTFPQKRILSLTSEGKRIAQVMWYLQDSFNVEKLIPRKKWMLRVFGVVGGEVKDATRLVKLMFLLKAECNVSVKDSDFYSFMPQKRGPYAKEIMDDTRSLEAARLIEIEEIVLTTAGDADIVHHIYRLTERGREVADELIKDVPENITLTMKDRLGSYNLIPLSDLLQYVHEKYPEFYRGDELNG